MNQCAQICNNCPHKGDNDDEDTAYRYKKACKKCDLVFVDSSPLYVLNQNYISIGEDKLRNNCPYYKQIKLIKKLSII